LGEPLTPDNVTLAEWPKDKIPPGAISRAEDIEGRHTRTRLIAGEPIMEGKLWGKNSREQGAAILIPHGYRPVTVKVDLVSGGGSLILPGDRVDVMLHVVKDPARDIPETITRTILQDVKVFAVNDVTGMEDGKGGTGKSIVAKTISLLVAPEQAARITLASQLGTIQLVMRSPDDNKLIENANARPADLFGESADGRGDEEGSTGHEKVARKTKPSPPPPASEVCNRPTWNIRLFRGSDVDEIQLEPAEAKADPASPSCQWRIVGSSVGSAGESGQEDNPPAAQQGPQPPAARPPLARPPEPRKTAADKSVA
jgi:pilus assembly protein CpaB